MKMKELNGNGVISWHSQQYYFTFVSVTVEQGQIQTVTVNQPLKLSLRSVEDQETTLPCRYEPIEGEVVVQVTWFKVHPDGSKEQMITAHFTDGVIGMLSNFGV